MDVRVLTGAEPTGDDLTDAELDVLYAAPRTPWLRVNMISTLDGAAAGEDDRSGSINNAADKRVFDCLRRLCDAVVVGAGTARAEGYPALERPVVLVSRRGEVPATLRDAEHGRVWLVTCEDAPGLRESRGILGADQVLVTGRSQVDLGLAKTALTDRGFRHLLCEGGPHLLRDLVAAAVLDELDLTLVPRLLGGDAPRILVGPPVAADLFLRLLLEDSGTLLSRWTS